MKPNKTISQLAIKAVVTLTGLLLLSQSALAAEILSPELVVSGQIKSAGLLDASYFEYSGPEFAVEIGDKGLQDEKIVKFQAEPVKPESTISAITKFLGLNQSLNFNINLINVYDDDLTTTATIPDANWLNSLINRFDAPNQSEIVGQSLKIQNSIGQIDIKYSPLDNGLKEEIIIAGDQEVYNNYQYLIKTDSGVILNTASADNPYNLASGTIYFTDAAGNYLAHFLPLTAYDSIGGQTTNINLSYELIEPDTYLLTVTVDKDWLYSNDRQYPVTIDPSIVHDTQGEFDNGTSLNRVEVTSDPKVQITDLPVGANIHSVGLWHMDESSGSTVSDSSGNSSTGTAVNSPSIIAGQFSNARNFNGSNQYISLANNNSILKIPGDITIEAWIRKPDATAGHIVRRDDYANYSFYADSVVRAWYYGSSCSGGAYEVDGVTNIADNQWHHVAYTKSGNLLSIYIDGRLDATYYAAVSQACTANSPVHIGAGVNSGDAPDNFFKGDIDEVQIFNTALTPEEIITHAQLKPYGVYTSEVINTGTDSPIFNSFNWTENGVRTGNGETDLTTNGLVAAWNFNETSGTSAADASGNGHTGTLTSMTTSGQDAAYNSGWTANNRKWGAGAVMFDGSNDYIIGTDNIGISGNPTFTIESWFKVNTLGDFGIVGFGDGNTSLAAGSMYLGSNGSLMLAAAGANNAATVSGVIKPGNWYHAVIVKTPGALNTTTKIYINGQEYSVSGSGSTPNITNLPVNFGRFPNYAGYYFNGIIDSTHIYSRALSVDEIISNYQAGNVQLQTRTGTDATPDDGSWEAWQPVSGSETQIDSYDNNEDNNHVIDLNISNATINQNWVKLNNVTASTTCDSGSACLYSDGRMGLGSSGTGDDAGIFTTSVIKDGATYKMWYVGNDGSIMRNYYATSSDGLTWTKYDNTIPSDSDSTSTNGRIPRGTTGKGDDSRAFNSTVIKDGSTYKMWYSGDDGSNYRIYFATSPDGLVWTKYNNTIPTNSDTSSTDGRLPLGTTGTGDDVHVFNPKVIKDGSTYKMWYVGYDGSMYNIFYATSSDGLSWTKYNNITPSASDNISSNGQIPVGTSGKGDDARVYPSTVLKDGGYYKTWYSGFDGTYWRIYYAISNDGLTWKKVNNTIPTDSNLIANNGQIPQGTSGTGDDDHVVHFNVMYDNGLYRAWYSGEDGSSYRVYYATMAPLPCSVNLDSNIKQQGIASTKISTGRQEPDSATVGLWHLDETGGSGAYLKDASGNANHATPSGTVNTVEGISRKAKSFGGSPNYAYNTTLSPTLTADLTIEGWFNTSTTPGEQVRILDLAQASTYGIQISMDTSGRILIDNSGGPTSYPTTTGRFDDGNWHYVAVTRSGTTYTLYVDGVSIGTSGGTAPTYTGLYFARRQSGTSYFNGKIDEVKLSNVVRTTDEIAEAYRAGRDHRINQTLISSVNLSNKSLVPIYIASDQPGTHTELTFGESEFANYMPDTNTIGLWHFEEQNGSGAYIKDSSSYTNHGTPTNTNYLNGKIGKGRYFNGSGNYISVPDNSSLQITDAITMQAWINPNTANSVGIIYKGSFADAQGDYQMTMYNYVPYCRFNNDALLLAANNAISANRWSHVVCTYDKNLGSNQVKLYINGHLNAQATYSTAIATSANNLYLGAYYSSVYALIGSLDEVRIDKTARGADEIRQAYEIGLRTHPVTIDFAATLDSGNLISGSGDTSFTVNAQNKGLPNKASNLYVGDKIIVRENYDGTEYIAQGTVNSINASTGAVTVASWDAGGTFPSGGYTVSADVFKWQREYIDISDVLPTHINAVNNITWRILDGDQGRTFWIDDLNMVSDYLTNPSGSTITSTPQQYFQYRIIETTTDTDPTPSVSSVTLDYSYPLTMTGGSTSESYLYNGNKTAFNVQCNGVAIAQAGKTVYCEGSWNQTNWYTVGSATSPLSGATIQGTPDVSSWTGYPSDGTVPLYVRATVDSNPTTTYSFNVNKDTTNPTINSITSVAGDPISPYYDTTDDSSSIVIFNSTGASACKWDETDVTYTAMANSCDSTSQCTLNLSDLGAKSVSIGCIDSYGNYNGTADNLDLNYTVGGVSMTGAQSSDVAINNYNNTSYNIQCNGVTSPETGTFTCYASFDQADWHVVDTATGPITNSTIENSVNVTGWTGYSPDGAKTIYAYVSGNTNNTEQYNFTSYVDTVYPVINSINSVAGDTAPPYEDVTNNGSTFVDFNASADSYLCKWSTTDQSYDDMPNSCGVSGNSCNLNLTGVAPHTAYIRCIDYRGNKQQSSLQVDYEIVSEAPILPGWKYYRDINITPATSLNDYQVKIELNTANFDYANAQPDGDDIRFYDEFGSVKFDYWIETWNPEGVSEVWVEIPASGTSKFMMEYGNSSALSESSYDNVFIKNYNFDSYLSGQWLYDEGSGSTAYDTSGQSNDGTLQNGVFWRPYDGGQWDSRSDIKFSSGAHIINDNTYGNTRTSIPDSPELDLTSAASFEMWFNVHSGSGSTTKRFLAKGHDNDFSYLISSTVYSADTVYVTLSGVGGSSPVSFTQHTWNHLIITYDGSNIKTYLNGQLSDTTPASGQISTNNLPLAIGNNAAGDQDRPIDSFIDDVRVYSRALSADEVTAHYEHRKYDAAAPQVTVGGVRTDTDSDTGQANWYNPSWSYRTALTIINEGNSFSLSDYQVQLNLDSKIYIEQSQMQPDGDDIRFTDSDGLTLLPYYIISGINTNNTRIYVRVPSIPANNNHTIYMYYGNTGVAAYENFDNTFTKDPNIDGIVSSWHFDEGADNSCNGGQDVCDSYSTNHGSFTGAPSWQGSEGSQWADRSDLKFSTGDYLYFNGASDFVTITSSSSMRPTTNHLAISAWIKPTSDAQIMPIFSQGLPTGYNIYFYLTSDKKLSFTYDRYSAFGYNPVNVNSSVAINPDVWTHVALVYSSNSAKFYRNGELIQTVSLSSGYVNYKSGETTYIAGNGNGNYFKGYMDQIEFNSENLNDSQILALYERRRGALVEPQAGYYRPGYLEKGGEIPSETWEAGNTYFVTQPVTITAGSTLVIEPGTVIKFAPGAYIAVNGSSMIAEGNANNPIYFTSRDDDSIGLTVSGSDGNPAAGDYYGIYIYGSGSTGSFKFCDFNYGGAEYVLDSTTFKGMLNTKQVNITAYNNVFNNSANADIFVYQASPDIQRNNLGDSPYGLYIEANGSILTNPIQYNSFANTTNAALYINGLPDTDNNGGPGLVMRHNDIDHTNAGFYIQNPSGSAIRDSNAENTVDANQNAFENLAGYMCYYDISAGSCKFDRTGGGEIKFDTNSIILESPNGGESYFAGSSQTIGWSFNNGTSNGDHIDIMLSTNSGAEFDQTVVAGLKCDGSGSGSGCTGNSGSYNWTVPPFGSSETRLKMVLKDSSGSSLVEDISDQNFSITVIEDTLSDYTPNADSTHTIKFVVRQNSGSFLDDSIKITFPVEFDLSVGAADVSASGGDVTWSSGEIVDTNSITFPFTGTLNADDGIITLNIGNSISAINNPETAGSYRVTLTVHDGQAGGGNALERLSTNILITEGLAFTINVESALQFSIRDITDSTDITTLDFGDISPNTIYDKSHILKVTTNAYNGYTVTAHEETDLTSNSTNIPDFTGTNSNPTSWTAPPGSGVNGYYGYHTSDSSLGTGTSGRFSLADRWAAMTSTPLEVAYSPSLVQDETTTMTYRLEVNSNQTAGAYSHTVLYICTPKY